MYQPYADSSLYLQISKDSNMPGSKVNKYLKEASRNIDILTYNRIVKKGFDNLTEFQKEIIQEVCCDQASFLYENEGILKTYLSNYSINGVNMSLGNSWNVYIEGGVAMDRNVYEKLSMTGLCCRSFYYG